MDIKRIIEMKNVNLVDQVDLYFEATLNAFENFKRKVAQGKIKVSNGGNLLGLQDVTKLALELKASAVEWEKMKTEKNATDIAFAILQGCDLTSSEVEIKYDVTSGVQGLRLEDDVFAGIGNEAAVKFVNELNQFSMGLNYLVIEKIGVGGNAPMNDDRKVEEVKILGNS